MNTTRNLSALTGTGKIVLDASQLELKGKAITAYCTYRIEGDVLTLAWWGTAADRQATPSTDKGGMVFKFKRRPKEKTKDA